VAVSTSSLRAFVIVVLLALPTLALASAPVATTSPATGITATSAILNGTGDPNAEPTTGWFRYSPTNPVTCNDGFGTRVPAVSGTDLGTGSVAVPYSITTTGLTAGVTYYFCSIVANGSGTSLGTVLSFTVAAPPVVLTTGANAITSSSATLQGSANPVASSTTGWFRYHTTDPGTCSDSFGVRVPSSGGTALGMGTSSVDYSRAATGLLPGTTYYYCAIAQNSLDTSVGAVLFFTTVPTAPSVTTLAASAVTTSSGVLNATGIARGDTAIGWFRYSTTNPGTCNDSFGTRLPASGGTALGSANTPVAFNQPIGGLGLATTIYFCAIAGNGIGTTVGGLTSFTTLATAPTLTTTAATSLTGTSAVLGGTGNPNGSSTTVWFRYSTTSPGTCNDSFGTRAPATSTSDTPLGQGSSPVAFSRGISGLTPTTTYYYCALGQNGVGPAQGAVLAFTTPAVVPVVQTLATTVTSGTSATFNGTANPNGAAATGWFRYSPTSPGTCNDSFGTRAPATGGSALGAGTTTVPFGEPVTSLAPLTTYYVCAIAANGLGTSFGAPIAFTTPAAPTVTTVAVSNLLNTSAQLNGTGNPNRAATTGWFRYATTNPGTCNDSFGSRAPVSGGSALGSGATANPYSQTITSLSAGATYYYCAIASNSEGLSLGAVLAFTTLAAPTTITSAATLVTPSTATLNGNANPNGASTTGYYRYATTNPGTCTDSFGTRAPTSGGSNLGAVTTPVSFAQAVTGLTPSTTYYFCAAATNLYGPTFGAVLSFATPAAAPTVVTNTPSMLTGATAQLNGTANPGADATTGWFRYGTVSPGTCNDSFGTRAPAAGGSALGAGTVATPYAQAIGGLTPATTYYVCAIAQNSVGLSFGALVTFVAPSPPLVVTNPASSVVNTQAVLGGAANPNRAASTGWFRYAATNPGTCDDSFGSRAPATGGTALGSGSSSVAYTQTASALSPGTTYYYCAIASSAEGMAFGAVVSFTTQAAPTVTTSAATAVTATSATLNGNANPNSTSTTGWYRYASVNPGVCSEGFGVRIPSSGGTNLGAGLVPIAYPLAVGGLTPATTYYYCAIAQNTHGISFGTLLTFTTPALPPTVSTTATTLATGAGATLNGSVNPNGDATVGWFRYATASPGTCNDSFGLRAPAAGGNPLGAGTTAVVSSQPITGLAQSTTYYVCAIAQNSFGISFGAVVAFTTPAPPVVVTNLASAVLNMSATLGGNANPNRTATTGYFRYATVDPGTCNDSFGSRAPATGGTALGAGASAVAYSQPISGLSAGVTYYVCAIATNGEGTGFGAVVPFTTLSAPTVVTNAATAVAATTATLAGTGDPNGATAIGFYRYATTSPGTCNDGFGTRAPASGGVSLGSGTAAVPYTQAIVGLTPATTYYYCALASNLYGVSTGALLTFTTPAVAATVTTLSPTLVTGATAQLNGSINPNGDATTGWYRYATISPGTCNDSFGTRAPATGGTAVGSGTVAVPYSQAISGLVPSTTYFVCAIGANGFGPTLGALTSFTTANVPTVTTNLATLVTAGSATLGGAANPNRSTTTGYFRYATSNPGACDDSFGTRAPASGGTALGAGATAVSYTAAVVGLVPATTYYVCAIATNGEGTGVGGVQTFTTLAGPTVTTLAATAIASTTATLNGTANPNGASTTGFYRYATVNPGACSDGFGTRLPSSGGTALGAGTTAVPYSVVASGLLPGATYYYCALAVNSVGTTWGTVMSFTADAGVPAVVTSVPTGITTTTATLNGSANPNGASTTGWFRIASANPSTCNDSFGTRVPFAAGSALGAGNSAVVYSEALTSLTPGTTYWYCAIAANASGTGYGIVRSFATPAPPTVMTLAATPITATTGTLNASANPNGYASTGWFRYAATDPGTCTDSFGTRMPATGGFGLGAVTTPVAYSQALVGLAPATTYYFCAIASSSIGTTLGEVLSFTTPPTLPSVTTLAATSVGPDSATLEATANPNGAASTGWHRYATTNPGACNDSFGTRAPATGGTGLGAGNSAVPYAQAITGLVAGTTYFYCAIASNGIGTNLGAVLSFTTASAPSVTTVAATSVASTVATLNGSANPNQSAATGYFRYAATNPGTCDDSFGTRAPATGGTALGAGASAVSFNQPIAGLTTGVTYFYCALATNSVGTRVGAVLSFTTAAVPLVTTEAATAVSSTTATINGTANPNLTAATGYFRYAATNPGTCSDGFGTRAPTTGGTALGSGSAPVAFSRPITGLIAGTTYYVCAIASNPIGLGFGPLQTFTTPGAPTVTTEAATAITTTTATLNGTANPNLTATTGYFRFATSSPGVCNDSFGTRAPTTGGTALGSGNTPAPYTQTLSTLAPGTTYFFCAIATSTLGTRFGAVMSLTTPTGPAVTTVAASALTSTGATLNGTANPNGSAATGWFRYATTSPGTCNDSFGTRAPTAGGAALGSGNTGVPYSEALTGLGSSTTYFYCAIAANASATSVGAVLSFTTPNAPTVTTTAASAVASTTATVNGSGVPNGAATTGYFRYDVTSPGTCDDSFGTRAPLTGGTSLGAGVLAVGFNQPLTGLAGATTYYYCAIGANSLGTRFGAVLSFTTTTAPTVTTDVATAIATTTATLGGAANPNLNAATGYFRYATTNPGTCNDSFGTRAPTTGGTALGAGSASVPYLRALTGLTAGTTYFYCAIASNSVGTGFGTVLSFTTAGPPTVTTLAPASITNTSAIFNAEANPNQSAATGYFRYATTSPGACNDSFGTRAPLTGGATLGNGTSAVAYTQTVSTLTAGATYYVCAIASNVSGTRFGAVLSFTTPAGPAVTTAAATLVTSTAATLNGSANPNLTAATGYFRYAATNPGTCSDAFGTRAPTTGGTALGSGSTTVAYSEAVTSLVAGTTYYYCALATNAVGTGVGTVLSFTTPGAPTVVTLPATAITSTGAMLAATANPNAAVTTGWFRYDTTAPGTCTDAFGTRAPITGTIAVGNGTTALPYGQALTGLVAGTTYYYCALATNAVGTRMGAVLSFTSAAPPTVTSEAATSVTATTATLNGTATPNQAATTAWFRYSATMPSGCDDSFGTRAPLTGGTDVGSGGAAVPYARPVTALAPATTYYYCAIASNPNGTRFGVVRTLVTPAGPPTVTTTAPTDVGNDLAVLNGAVLANGATTTAWFRYANINPGTCNDSFGARAPTTGGENLGNLPTAVAYSQTIVGLTPHVTYFACAIASNASGTSFGAVVSFEPGATPPTVTTEPATAIDEAGGTLAGTANPNGADATGWFRFSVDDPGTCDDSFGTRAPATGGTALGAGTAAVPFDLAIDGLEPNLTVFYCAVASNLGGASFGAVRSFKTDAVPPVVRTVEAVADAEGNVALAGAADPRGSDTNAWFRYAATNPGACDDSFGVRTAGPDDSALGAGRVEVDFGGALTELEPGEYFVCAIASNGGGIAFGAVLRFVVPNPGGDDSGGCCRVANGGSVPPIGTLVPVAAAMFLLIRRRRPRR